MTTLADARIVVTGGAGFLGSRVVDRFRKAGADVLVPRSRDFDFTNQSAAAEYVRQSAPDIVVHLAAEVGGIGANQANPGRYFFANMAMGLHLIEACREYEVDKYVQAGTVCSYPKHTPVPFNEDDLWNGFPEETNAPYGVAKKALLTMLQAYRDQYSFNGIYLIPVNLYGPGDNFDLETSHVIPALIRKFVAARDRGEPSVEVWGTGTASREFLFVDDAAEAIVLATERYDEGEPVNIGAGSEITIKDLVTTISRLIRFDGEVVWDSSRPDGQPRRMLDTSRASERFGFKAQVILEEGLARTIRWWEEQGQAGV